MIVRQLVGEIVFVMSMVFVQAGGHDYNVMSVQILVFGITFLSYILWTASVLLALADSSDDRKFSAGK